ncbi:uncharacterized protein TNCV_2397061 [Trichonephila clavipes]|uniref:Uncharacterized protein n=1 Tax=Trichonephila clavipes TaxID=2585209 RepID=A0A8X6SR71_TRICX|nr:uncharacterized protein TNCV_2397061 [Trichonephila clavipes]
MNFLFHLFVVTFVALNAAIFTSASCDDDSDEESFFSFISYDVQILSDEQRTSLKTFVNTVVETVYGRDTLRDVFDISDSTALQFQQYSYQVTYDILKELGSRKSDVLADFATRPIAQNFEYISRETLVTVYANVLASYSREVLTEDNASEFAIRYTNYTENQAKNLVVQGVTTSKYQALAGGFLDYMSSVGTITVEKAQALCVLFQSQWLFVASETKSSNDLYMKCVTDANGDSDESSSESDSSSSESDYSSFGSDYSNSGSDYSSSGSSSSSSESGSNSSGSSSSSSESGSNSSESGSNSSGSSSSSSESGSNSSGSSSSSSESGSNSSGSSSSSSESDSNSSGSDSNSSE